MASSENTIRFRDIGDLGRTAGFDLGFRQLDSGAQAIPATVQLGEHTTLVHMRFNRAFHQLGSPPAGMTTIGIPICNLQNWFGRAYEASSILPFNVASGIDGVSQPGFQAFTLSVDSGYLGALSRAYRLPMPDCLLAPVSGSVIRNSQPVQRLRSALRGLSQAPGAPLGMSQEEDIGVALLIAAAGGVAQDRSTPSVRARALAKALDFVEAHRFEPVTLGEVCSATGVASRTLYRAFQERFGIGPKAYLKRLRLSAVRDELSACGGSTVVADVANARGFWHMGQFARDYRALFGELPSETSRVGRAGRFVSSTGGAAKSIRRFPE